MLTVRLLVLRRILHGGRVADWQFLVIWFTGLSLENNASRNATLIEPLFLAAGSVNGVEGVELDNDIMSRELTRVTETPLDETLQW